jgi:hypothetical protein
LVTDIGFRLILLVPIPAIFLMMLYNGRKARALLIAITIFLAIGYTSYGTQSPFPYFSAPIMWNSNFLNAVPSSILQNTVPLEDSQTVGYLFKNLRENIQKDNSSIALTFEPMLAYAVLSGIPMDRIVSLGMMANQTQLMQYLSNGKVVYVVWWKTGYEWYGINMSGFVDGLNYSILDSKGNYDVYLILPTLESFP